MFFQKMLPNTTGIIRGLRLSYINSKIRYTFWNKCFNDFLEGQMSKHKLTSLLRVL